jgi:opacity protein-like surface antigen
MRSRSLWFLLAALAATPVAADAQVRIGVGGGPSTPMGDFADEAGSGFLVQGSVTLGLPLLPIGLRGDAVYQQFADERAGTYRQAGALAGGTLGLPLPLPLLSPYVLGEVGAFHHRFPEATHAGHAHGEDGTASAFAVGGGVRLGLPGIAVSVEARYLDAGKGVRSVPITASLHF